MISIESSHVVTPSGLTPSSDLILSLCDQIKLPDHDTQLFIYAANHASSAAHTLATSLAQALTIYYPFAGRLRRLPGGRHLLQCNAQGALLIQATCCRHLSFPDLCHFAPAHAVPAIDYTLPIGHVPLLVVQLTRFPCGTLTLAIALCRALLDGASVTGFVNTWAKLARGENLDSTLFPLHDRSILDSRRLNKPPRFQHPEFFPPPLWTQQLNRQVSNSTVAEETTHLTKDNHDRLDFSTEINGHEVLGTAILRLTKVQVQKLKDKASDFATGYGSPRPYTSFEVISGHLWKCVCKVRYVVNGNGSQPTRLTTLVNCRNRLSPSLPWSYFGNATFPTVTRTCSFDGILGKPVGYAVGRVREAVEKMNDEYVRSVLDYIGSLEDMDLFRNVFYNSGGGKGREPNLYVVGWTNFAYLETDFGWGKPLCLLPGNINSDGKAFILDTATGDGFVVAVCLQASLIDHLNKLFYEDIENPASKL